MYGNGYWFVVFEILPLLMLIGLLTWWLTRWYYTSRYEDVTESYSRAMQRLDDRDEAEARESQLTSQIQSVRGRIDKLTAVAEAREEVDLDPVLDRLEALERRMQLGPLETRLASLEAHIAELPNRIPEPPVTDLGPITARITSLEHRLVGVAERVDALPEELPEVPETDLNPLHQRLHGIEERLEGLSGAGLGGLTSGLAAVSSTVSALRMPDLGPVEQRLGMLEGQLAQFGRSIPEPVDLGPVGRRLAALEERIDSLRPPDLSLVETRLGALLGQVDTLGAREVDFTVVTQRLGALEERLDDVSTSQVGLNSGLASMSTSLQTLAPPDLEPMELRLMELEELVARIPTVFPEIPPPPPVDFSPVVQRLATLEGRLGSLEMQVSAEVDLGSWGDRLLSMEARMDQLASWDLRALDRKLAAVSSMIAAWGSPDLTSIEQRLTRIEQRLGRIAGQAWETPTPAPAQTRVAAPPVSVRVATDTPPPVPVRVSAPKVVRTVVEPPAVVVAPEPAPVPVVEPPPPVVEPVVESRPITEERSTNGTMEAVQRPGRGTLLRYAAFGSPDDLKQISGVGPKLEAMLHDIGVYYFWQVSMWSDEDVAYVDELLEAFKGRIERDEWVLQAMDLATQPGAAEPPDA